MQLIYGSHGELTAKPCFSMAFQCILAFSFYACYFGTLEAVIEFYKLTGLLVNVVNVGNQDSKVSLKFCSNGSDCSFVKSFVHVF